MGKKARTRKFAQTKRMLSAKDARFKTEPKKKKKDPEEEVRKVAAVSSSLFFQYNAQLGPPYHVLVDTNFINFSIQNKLEMVQSMMECLFAKCIPCVTDCVIAELEKLGRLYRVALRIAKDPRFKRLKCTHSGTYADDCLVDRVTEADGMGHVLRRTPHGSANSVQHKCYIVATCDRDLKRRIRRIPGVPIMYIRAHKYSIERMPEAFGAPSF